MAENLKNYIHKLPLSRRRTVKERSSVLIAEEKTLQELRKASACSQKQLASILDVNQAAISKLERRTDMYVSTLRSFIEGMGGKLDIIATLPHKPPIKINQFQDLDEI